MRWKLPQQYGINHGEHRGIHADAQRQRQHRHGREAGILAQLPKGVSQVLEKSGFQFEGRLHKHVIKDGQILDSLLYAKTM